MKMVSITTRRLLVRCATGLGLAVALVSGAWAQATLRDPMQMPAALAQLLSAVKAAAPQPAAAPDPVVAEHEPNKPDQPKQLQMVMVRGDQAYAVIDGHRVAKGQGVGGWVLLDIQASAVELQWNDQRIKLSMFAPVLKSAAEPATLTAAQTLQRQ